jgi:hypothetical protein
MNFSKSKHKNQKPTQTNKQERKKAIKSKEANKEAS